MELTLIIMCNRMKYDGPDLDSNLVSLNLYTGANCPLGFCVESFKFVQAIFVGCQDFTVPLGYD